MESTPALLLRRTRFSETSLIVTWLTLHHGKLKTIAKGALRPKGTFSGLLDLFFELEIAFARSKKSEIHTLREAMLISPHEGVRRDYSRVELASYFVELVELATEPEHPVPEIYDLLQRALRYLETHAPNRKAMLHFERELAKLLGLHVEGGNAYLALLKTLHHLPSNRAELLKRWPEEG